MKTEILKSKDTKTCQECGNLITSNTMHAKVNGIRRCIGCHFELSSKNNVDVFEVQEAVSLPRLILIAFVLVIFAIVALGVAVGTVNWYIGLVAFIAVSFSGLAVYELMKEVKND